MADQTFPQHPPGSWSPAVQSVSPIEQGRKMIVILVTIFFLLLIFEGALRKWGLPSFQRILLFARDPVVIAIYLIAAARGYIPWNRFFLVVGLVGSVVGLFVMVMQVASSGTHIDPILMAFGWRNHFFYIPLAFIIATTFTMADIDRIGKIAIYSLPPMVMLMATQHGYPADHWINAGFGSNPENQFIGLRLVGHLVRPTGFFTSSVGVMLFLATCTVFLLGFWMRSPAERSIHLFWLVVGSVCLLGAVALSGSRFALVQVGIIIIAATVSAFVTGRTRAAVTGIAVPMGLVVLAVTIIPLLFGSAIDAFLARIVEAQAVEGHHYSSGFAGRIIDEMTRFVSVIQEAPDFGWGMGIGTNAGVPAAIRMNLPWIEDGLSRHIADLGPYAGIGYVLYRVVMMFSIMIGTLKATRLFRDALPLLMFSFTGVLLLHSQISGHSSTHGFGWMCIGLSLAMIYLAQEQMEAENQYR